MSADFPRHVSVSAETRSRSDVCRSCVRFVIHRGKISYKQFYSIRLLTVIFLSFVGFKCSFSIEPFFNACYCSLCLF